MVRHSIFIAGYFQKAVSGLRSQIITLFIGSTMNIGNIQRTWISLMIPRNKEVGTVFHQCTAQWGSKLVSREIIRALVAADIIFAGQPVGTQISESATCQLVGSRFGHRTNSTSSGTTVSHIIFIRHDFELTDSLHRNGVWHTVATGCTTSRSRALGTHAINGIISRRSQLSGQAGTCT